MPHAAGADGGWLGFDLRAWLWLRSEKSTLHDNLIEKEREQEGDAHHVWFPFGALWKGISLPQDRQTVLGLNGMA